MSSDGNKSTSNNYDDAADVQLRRGPWTLEEDSLLIHCIACNGEGRWDMLAKCSGLKRSGKSCRLRWLNYLKPDVKRGNLTLEEQLLILRLHSKWGNRWSRIAQHLPGRTDNEIKNYWRTRVQKQARQQQNKIDAIRSYWMPRMAEEEMEESSSSIKKEAETSFSVPAPAPAHALQESPPPSSKMQDSEKCNSMSSSFAEMGCGYYMDDMEELLNLNTMSVEDSLLAQGSAWGNGDDRLWNMDDL